MCVNIEVTSGDRVSVVFFEPLYGGSPEEWVTGLTELRGRFLSSSIPVVRQAKVPPQGFSEDYTGPSACHFSAFDLMAIVPHHFFLDKIF